MLPLGLSLTHKAFGGYPGAQSRQLGVDERVCASYVGILKPIPKFQGFEISSIGNFREKKFCDEKFQPHQQ
jgi:hypothetical protein